MISHLSADELTADVVDFPIGVLGSCLPWFNEFLGIRGLRVPPGSALAAASKTLLDLRARASEPLSFPSAGAALRYFQDAHGADFLTKILHMGHRSGLELPSDRVREILKGDPIVTRPGSSSTSRNRTWELVLASAAATFATNVRLEEPDVVCSFQGREFFMPIKVAYSQAKLFERIKEGVDQAAERPHGGVVVVDVVELLPLQAIFDRTAATNFASLEAAGQWLRQWSRVWHEQWPLEMWSSAIRRRTGKSIGVAFFLPLIAMLRGLPRTCWLVDMPLRSTRGPDYDFTTAIVQCFDRVLGYTP